MIKLPSNIARSYLSGVGVIVLSVLIVYFPVLDSPFRTIYDSDHILGNALLRDPGNIPQILTRNLFNADAPYRPLALLSHMAEERAFGWTPYYFYLVNIVLHAGAAVLVFALLTMLAKDRMWGFLTALVFALHPAHWEAVSFLSGRAVLLSALFNLAALAACARYMRGLNGGWLALSLMSFVCAIFSYEAYLPVTAVIFFYTVLMASGQPKSVRWLAFLPYGVVALMFALIRRGSQGFRFDLPENIAHVGQQFLNAFKVVFIQMGILAAPYKIHFHQTTDAWQGFNDPRVVLTLVVLVLAGAAMALLRAKKDTLLLFLTAWLIAGLWPVLNSAFRNAAVPVDGTMSYMASIPFVALLLLAGKRVLLVLPKGRWLTVVILLCLLTGFGILTFKHNVLAVDEMAVLNEARRYKPESAILEYQSGLVCASNNAHAKAQEHFERALALDSNFTSASMGLGKALYDQGKLAEAAKAYESIRNPGRYRDVLAGNLRVIYSRLAAEYEAVVVKDPNNVNALFSLGIYYDKIGDANRAIAAFQQVIELDPQGATGLTGIALRFQGLIFDRVGQAAKAQENFARAQSLSSQVSQ